MSDPEATSPEPQGTPPPPEPPQPSGGGSGSSSSYPVDLTFDRGLEVSRWRPLVNWLLAFPHWIVDGSGSGSNTGAVVSRV